MCVLAGCYVNFFSFFLNRVWSNEKPTALHLTGRGTIVLFVQVEILRVICAALHVIELFCYFYLPHLYGL